MKNNITFSDNLLLLSLGLDMEELQMYYPDNLFLTGLLQLGAELEISILFSEKFPHQHEVGMVMTTHTPNILLQHGAIVNGTGNGVVLTPYMS